jgi:hypothetical protein
VPLGDDFDGAVVDPGGGEETLHNATDGAIVAN